MRNTQNADEFVQLMTELHRLDPDLTRMLTMLMEVQAMHRTLSHDEQSSMFLSAVAGRMPHLLERATAEVQRFEHEIERARAAWAA